MLKMIKLVLSVVLIITFALSGCSFNRQATINDEQANNHVKLKWVFIGPGKLVDSDMVWGEYNEKIQDFLPNTNVEFEVITSADYAERWQLMSASREKVDIAWTGFALNPVNEIERGAYMPLDNLIEQYAPNLKEELPGWVFDKGRYHGEIYFVPNYQMMVDLPQGMRTHKELADKYDLDTEKITEIFTSGKQIVREDFRIIEDYLENLKQNGDIRQGVSITFLHWVMKRMIGLPAEGLEAVASNAVVVRGDKNLKVYDRLNDFPDKYDYYDMISDWYKKGYIRRDIMSIQDLRQDEGKENGYVLWSHQAFKGESERQTETFGFPIIVVPMVSNLYVDSTRSTTNTAIPTVSTNPERAIQLIELMNSKRGKSLYNLLIYGVEGEHYQKVSDNRIEWLGNTSPGGNDNRYGYSKWALGNTFNAYETQHDPEGWNDYIKNEINGKAEISPLLGFSLDMEPIKIEVAQYRAVAKEYEYLDLGATPNYKEKLQERNGKLREAGSDKIVAEVRRQVDVWAEEKGLR